MAVAFTTIGALVAETASPHSRGLAMGGYNTSIYFGVMTGSFGLGPILEWTGFAGGFAATGLVNLPFVAAFAWLTFGYRREP